jgi:spermidine dehydrogenase
MQRDIEAITVSRWPHGYGYEYNPLFDPEWPAGQAPHILGRKRFGMNCHRQQRFGRHGI